jgi:hypothetical protein
MATALIRVQIDGFDTMWHDHQPRHRRLRLPGTQDWAARKVEGVVFAFAKASEGQTSRDGRFVDPHHRHHRPD